MSIEIIYALPGGAHCSHLTINTPITARQALHHSGLVEQCNIDLSVCTVGVYGRLIALDDRLASGDRLEIYRPLLHDPKEIRRRRIKQSKS